VPEIYRTVSEEVFSETQFPALSVLGNSGSIERGPGLRSPALAVVSSLQLPQWLANLEGLGDLTTLGL
jgi:hypothetical protein